MFALLRALRSKIGRRFAAGGLAIGAVVAMATEVFACTAIMGPLYFSPSSAHAGSVVLTTASGLKSFPAKYDLFWDGVCMTFSGKLLKTITTNVNGGWTNVKITIPKNASLGSHSLCGIEAYPNAGQTDTDHGSFTVI